LVGTHALLEDVVQFKNLGLVIIDEQHRFGVAQRSKLWQKNTQPPHILVMTATPIPRTLAMTVYGDLDVSVIDELPPGRKPIQTLHFYDSKRLPMFGFLKKQIEAGRQVYVVYPLIKESENLDLKFLEDGYEAFSREFPPPKYNICVVHGQLKNDDKDMSMQMFVSGKAQIMIATTVIEVGVDVPNATVMVIESAERFGLSQLHQLRGRVGRGAEQSFCILMTSYKLTTEARKRINALVASNDGFELAELDLKLRGPGDLDGTQQSGVAFDLKIANIAKDGQILQYARDIALEILNDDPELSKPGNLPLKSYLIKAKNRPVNWSVIS
jgi:ATP-dependent DNA helicase RecG